MHIYTKLTIGIYAPLRGYATTIAPGHHGRNDGERASATKPVAVDPNPHSMVYVCGVSFSKRGVTGDFHRPRRVHSPKISLMNQVVTTLPCSLSVPYQRIGSGECLEGYPGPISSMNTPPWGVPQGMAFRPHRSYPAPVFSVLAADLFCPFVP